MPGQPTLLKILCRINMFLHDIGYDKFTIGHGDVLTKSISAHLDTYVTQEDKCEAVDIIKLNAEIDKIVAREEVLPSETAAIIAEDEGARA